MYSTREVGGLAIIEETRERADVNRELSKLTPPGGYPQLFAELQIDLEGEPVWCVCAQVSGDEPAFVLLEWRDELGKPIPQLTSAVIERVKAMEGAGDGLVAEIRRRRQERREKAAQAHREQYREIADDMLPLVQGKRSHPVHRSVRLRMTKDKQRARGEKT